MPRQDPVELQKVVDFLCNNKMVDAPRDEAHAALAQAGHTRYSSRYIAILQGGIRSGRHMPTPDEEGMPLPDPAPNPQDALTATVRQILTVQEPAAKVGGLDTLLTIAKALKKG